MHRFRVPAPWDVYVRFSPEQQHQLHRVLRLRRGDTVGIHDGAGRSAQVEIEYLEPHCGGFIVPGSERQVPWPLPVRPLLYLALIRPQRFEWAIEKATELAAWRIVPLLTERTSHGGAEVSETRLRRWQNIAIEAAEQCGCAYVPELARPLALPAALREPAALSLFASTIEGGGERASVRTTLGDLRAAAAASSPDGLPEVAIFIGPEGGFTDTDLAQARAAGCRFVTLGPLTLRAETAALAALVGLGEALRDTPNA